jgi:DNA polymerase III beta subunit
MKATVNRLKLIGIMTDILMVTGTKCTLPIATATLFQVKGGLLTMAGNDLQTALTASLKAKVARSGQAVAFTKPVLNFLKAVTSETVTLSDKGKTLVIEAGRASTTLEAMSVKDYPPLPKRILSTPAVVTNLRTALGSVDYAMAKIDNRPVLNGVYMDGSKLAAADGFRLAVADLKARGKLPKVIIESKAVGIIKALFPGPVKIAFRVTKTKRYDNTISETQLLQVESKDRLLVTMGVSGKYPDYAALIPSFKKLVILERKDMLEALKLMITANPTSVNHLTRLVTKGKNLLVQTFHDEAKTEMAIPCQGKLKIALNAKQASEVIGHLPDGQVTMRWDEAKRPVVFKTPGSVHIVMPMFVAEWEKTEKPASVTPPTEAAAAVAEAERITAETRQQTEVASTN